MLNVHLHTSNHSTSSKRKRINHTMSETLQAECRSEIIVEEEKIRKLGSPRLSMLRNAFDAVET